MGGTPPLIMHVLHHLVIGGMENGVVNLINHMPKDSYRHAVVCIEDFSEFRNRIHDAAVPVIAMRRSVVGTWGLRRALYALFREHRPAIVHTRNLSGLDALLPAVLAGVPHRVHSEHGWDVDNLDGSQWKPAMLRRLHSPLVNRYVTVSKDLERYLVDRVGIAAGRITQIYNGVDTARFAPQPRQPLAGMPAGFLDPEAIVIGTVGRIQAVKDQATLLRAFATLRGQCPEQAHRLRLMIIGNGPLLAELRGLAITLGIADACWLPGSLEQVPSALACMDIFVLPSLMEGTSNTLLEAMAAGLPVLATAVGGNTELLAADTCGQFFAPGDQAALVALLRQQVEDDGLRRRQGANGRALINQRFSLQAMTGQYRALYEGVCAAR